MPKEYLAMAYQHLGTINIINEIWESKAFTVICLQVAMEIQFDLVKLYITAIYKEEWLDAALDSEMLLKSII